MGRCADSRTALTPPPRPDERGVLVDHPDKANYDGQVPQPQQDEGDGA